MMGDVEGYDVDAGRWLNDDAGRRRDEVMMEAGRSQGRAMIG